jgi:hypothetical protein
MATSSPDSCNDTSYDTFHLFPNLPTELRLGIWKIAAHETCKMKLKCFNRKDSQYEVECFMLRYAAAMLRVCQESRSVALLSYTKAFSVGNNPRYIWKNRGIDDFVFFNNYMDDKVKEVDDRLLGRLAVSMHIRGLFIYTTYPNIVSTTQLKEAVVASFHEIDLLSSAKIGRITQDERTWAFEWRGVECPRMIIKEQKTDIEMGLQEQQPPLRAEVVGTFVLVGKDETKAFVVVSED